MESVSVIERIIIKRNKKVDSLILAEIRKIATENGIDTIVTLNDKAIVSALKKQIPKKPKIDADEWTCCPNCYSSFKILDSFKERNRYCGNCGQALDWNKESK